MKRFAVTLSVVWMVIGLMTPIHAARAAEGWLDWRGPNQNGTSPETGLPDDVSAEGGNLLWTFDMQGRGTPVLANGTLYVWGYKGAGVTEESAAGPTQPRAAQADLREFLVALDPSTGEEHWRHAFNDFLSDTIYERYSIGSPAVDPETGDIFLLTTAGEMAAFTPGGEMIWKVSMMEDYGRLTFPNGRIGAPVIEGDLVIVHGITSNWGSDGPARDRFYAYDKRNGQLVWSSTPGTQPTDSSFSTPTIETRNGKRVFYAGTGCGNIVCVNALTGDPIWRYEISNGGVNSGVLIYKDSLIALHGNENLDNTTMGRMIAIKLGAEPGPGEEAPKVLDKSYELWRNDAISHFTSSPVLVGDKIYMVVETGELYCVDANNGKTLWTLKLANGQLHASPLYADGKLYIPIENGTFYILKPGEKGCEILDKEQLDGLCIGSPMAYDGKIYVHTTKKLYCFGDRDGHGFKLTWPEPQWPKPGKAVALQIEPSEVILEPGETQRFSVNEIDANGYPVKVAEHVAWESFVPPTAKVKAHMDAAFNDQGELAAGDDAKVSAGAYLAQADGLKGTIRGRILPKLPFSENFDSFELSVPHATEKDVKFAYPPLPWIGARFKWEIRDREGEKVLAKTLDNNLFQRAITFIGPPEASNYTVQADVLTDGNRRMMSSAGVINQRYIIALVGNWRIIEVSSNHERLKVSAPFDVKPNTWYTIKSRVDINPDGSGVIRGKAWPRGEAEPEAWTIEVPHKHAHTEGAPGLYGFSPQSRFRVYVDNVSVTPNE